MPSTANYQKYMITEESTNSIPTTLEDIEEAFIYRDIPTKNLKRNLKADGTPTISDFFAI